MPTKQDNFFDFVFHLTLVKRFNPFNRFRIKYKNSYVFKWSKTKTSHIEFYWPEYVSNKSRKLAIKNIFYEKMKWMCFCVAAKFRTVLANQPVHRYDLPKYSNSHGVCLVPKGPVLSISQQSLHNRSNKIFTNLILCGRESIINGLL